MRAPFAEIEAQYRTLLGCSYEWEDTLFRCDRLQLSNRRLIANDPLQAMMTVENNSASL